MHSPRESVLPHDHDVTFYDADSHLIDELAEFVTDGLALGEAVVLVATPEHHTLLAATLAAAGCSLDEAVSRGQYVAADAADTMATFLRHGSPDPDLYFAHVGGLLERVALSGRPMRVFGEMVALLWDQGNVTAALELEALWNRLGRLKRFSLLCAYPTSSLTDADDLASVRSVCQVHSEVLPPVSYEGGDASAIPTTGSSVERVFVATPPAIRGVRHLVTETLQTWGLGFLAGDAALLVSELATNAMRHADSPFRASISRTHDSVRISVEDLGSGEPRLRPADLKRLGGRGVALVDAMSLSWGCEPARAGKVVWCELPVTDRVAG